ncbi:VENN motif pre-toxin domain-containing protein [Burkholderia ubonensis]|uniref:VENN motif pre-toxin domain-containing protein n=1 Tax=Burkholderia ubonensis TaxID=101571 RepID=UPI0018E03A26|nr:VENN motif pre-toxin domain-containing protein [Burkholderia ubonensis]
MAPLLVDQAGGSNNLTAGQRAAIVGVSTLLGGLTAGLAGQNAMAGATAAENESLNNATSTKNPKFAAKMLGYDYNTFGNMLHVLKPANGLGPADNLIFHSNGDVEFSGKIIDNLHNYAP